LWWGIRDIEDIEDNKVPCKDIQPRGWTAKHEKITGKSFVLVNMFDESLSGVVVKAVGEANSMSGRVPVRTPQGKEILVRSRNLAIQGSAASTSRMSSEEARTYQLWVDSENSRISKENVDKIASSPQCGGGKCAGACFRDPGMEAPCHVRDMISRGVFDPTNYVLDFYQEPGKPSESSELSVRIRPSVAIIRPRKDSENGASLAPYSPKTGAPCVFLGPHGCTRRRSEMPPNCRALHCDKRYHVPLSKHDAAYELWDNQDGREIVAWFQKQIQAKDPTAPTAEDFYWMMSIETARSQNKMFAHELSCARVTEMIPMITERLTSMLQSPDPEILDIIKKQLQFSLRYADDLERELLETLDKSLTIFEKVMARK
jgi:hypothetical protein